MNEPYEALPQAFARAAIDPSAHAAPTGSRVATGDALLAAYGLHGGLCDARRLSQRLRATCAQPVSALARWIVDREVVSFEHAGEILLPLFQFEPASWRLRREVTLALGELRDVLGDDELASWFASPNTWLGHRAPLELIADAPSVVHAAARADRFVVRG